MKTMKNIVLSIILSLSVFSAWAAADSRIINGNAAYSNNKFDEAIAEGTLTAVLGTNLTYRKPELLSRDWYFDVDCSKYCAYFVAAINHEMSVSSICDPIKKIEALLDSRS